MDIFSHTHPSAKDVKVTQPDLLPCPFCGGMAYMTGKFPQGQYYIRCEKCRASIWADRRDKAIGLWNTRNHLVKEVHQKRIVEELQHLRELYDRVDYLKFANTDAYYAIDGAAVYKGLQVGFQEIKLIRDRAKAIYEVRRERILQLLKGISQQSKSLQLEFESIK